MNRIFRDSLSLACAAGWFVAESAVAADTYACHSLDIKGSAFTQVWRLNDANQVTASGSTGGFLYDPGSGQWTPLPAPPAISGYSATTEVPYDINNFGEVVGGAFDPLFTMEEGFLLSSASASGTYTFVPPLALASVPTYTNMEFRDVSDNGLITGWIYPPAGSPAPLGQGFIFNPTGSTIATFAPGYTAFTPKLSDGSAATWNIPSGMNAAGLFVGRAISNSIPVEEAYLYNPTTLTKYTLSLGANAGTAARGINDLDPHSSANCTSANCVRVVGWAGANGIYVDFDPATGFQVPQIVDCSAGLPNATSVVFEGINNSDIISGQWTDSLGNSHGLIAYPNAVMPTVLASGAFSFTVTVAANVAAFLDPPIAVGYAYASNDDSPKFGSVTLPIGVGGDQYTLLVNSRAFALPAGKRFDFTQNGFAHGVRSFNVVGISPSANVDAANPTAFVTEVTFVADGQFVGTMTPLSAAAEIASLKRSMDDAPRQLSIDIAVVARDYANSNITGTCTALASFIADVQAVMGVRLSFNHAGYLTAQAQAIESAVACP